MNAHRAKFEQAMVELRSDFLETASDHLDDIEALLFAQAPNPQESLPAIYRHAHSLKGGGGTFGLPSVSVIAHRLEDFLSSVSGLDEGNANETMAFVDTLRVIVTAGKEPGPAILQDMLRSLPAPHGPEFEVESSLAVEVLLVTPSNAVGRIVARQLSACGYRVTQVDTPWEAFQMAVYTCPDMIITSVVLDSLTGIDLLNALRAMAPTRDIPVAVMTSFIEDHPTLAGIPADTPLIRSGDCFQDDLADALTELGVA